MSAHEQNEVTQDLILEVEEQREMKSLSARNGPLSSFGDVKKTLDAIEYEVFVFRPSSKLGLTSGI